MIILTGCSKTVVKTVPMSDFCSRYEPLWLDKEDFNNIIEIRKKYNVMNKYIDYHTINAKEFDLCQ